ncbi:hypothetical protein BBP40_005575 [Aspergillus hancockii]|nr:hypothetical protein BBP40_005575 [Aspergillus hancockii]
MAAIQDPNFDFRSQLIPHIIDHYAKIKPDAVYAEYPISPLTYESGYRPITYRALANAINGVAWWLTEKLGPGNGEILPYVGPNDVRYPALILGAVKAGYSMFLTSPRNSVVAHNSLFACLNCTKFVATAPRLPPVAAILDAHQLEVLEVPGVDELVNTEYPHFKYTKTYPEAATENLVVVHTSGSTGIPKPIFFNHDTSVKHMHMSVLDPPEGFESQDSWLMGKRLFLTLPPFHAAGMAHLMFIGLSLGLTLICPTSGGLPTAAALVDAHKKTPFEVALVVPSILQELSQSPELLDYCSSHLGHLVYCGGDLPQQIGDTVASKIKVVNQLGASEMGMLSSIHSKTNRNPLKDWRYIHFHPALGTELRRLTDDEYELFLVRNPEREGHLVTFAMFPHLHEYSTKDLFVRHPDPNKSDLWRWSSRADDVIVFLNGEKTNPVSMEQHITVSNPEVNAALVAGAQRFQASLIIELSGKGLSPSERAAVIERIWPSIEEANAVCPAHARIAKTHILFTKPDKPMPRSGKGTVQRAATLALYAQELDALYADADRLSSQEGDLPGPGRVNDAQLVSDFIRQIFSSITGWSKDQLGDEVNLFKLGLDSLQAITAARSFRRGLAFPGFTPNLIYLHPSVAELTQAVLRLQQDHESSEVASKETQLEERKKILEEFQSQIILPEGQSEPNPTQDKQTVVLTGSTGTLGTYILDALLKNPSVTHVHCLNRKVDSAAAQRQKTDFYGLITPLDSARVSFWTVDLSQNGLGLPPDTLKTLQDTATLVIHNAWAVNFNLSLASFRPHLSGLVNLINFCSSSAKSAHLFFISSISSVMGHQTESHITPEAVITTNTPAPNGYANSKYLSEQLLDFATRKGTIRASFARLGQIAGAVRSAGLWNKAEWFPSLVLSSLHVGAVPDSLGSRLDQIDWVPIDLLAEVLTALTLGKETSEATAEGPVVFHPLNPHPLTWEAIRPAVVDALSKHSGKGLEVIPAQAWVQRVRQDLESNRSLGDKELQGLLEKNPAAKLLGFFEESLSQSEPDNRLDTTLTANKSEALRSVSGIKPEWINQWIMEWMQ